MSSVGDLPVEILELVFSTIADDDEEEPTFINPTLTQCQLVCKKWSELALIHKYHNVVIYEPDHFSNLLAVLTIAEQNPGIYLKELTIDYWDEVVVPHEGLIKLLLLKCPNIEKLLVYPDATDGHVFVEILKACKGGACKRLKRIPELIQNSTEEANDQYLDALYCLRDSLEELVLDESLVVNSNRRTHSRLQNLKDFPNLRFLTLGMESIETVYQLGKLIDSCPSIMDVDLNWIPKTNITENRGLDVRSTTPCPTVKTLKLHTPVTRKMLEYIMHAFPDLSRFTMHSASNRYGEFNNTSSNIISNNLWVQFLVYLNRRENFVQVHRLYISDVPGVLSAYFNTVDHNKGLIILYDNDFYITKPYVTIDFDVSFFQSPASLFPIITATCPIVKNADKLPHLKLLRRTGQFLNFLKFGSRHLDCSAYLKDQGFFFLDHIFMRCPSLQGLELSCLTIADCSPKPQANTSIKHVQMFKCNLSRVVFPELSVRLVSLSSLCLSDHFHVDSKGRVQQEYRNFIIEMPHTSFDTLTWKRCARTTDIDYTSISLKIVTSAKSYYYCAKENGAVAKSSDISFYKSMDIQTTLSMYIRCKDIKHLNLSLYHRSWQINFT